MPEIEPKSPYAKHILEVCLLSSRIVVLSVLVLDHNSVYSVLIPGIELRDDYEKVPSIKSRLVYSKASALPAVLSPPPQDFS